MYGLTWFTLRTSFQCTPYSNDCEALCPFSDLSVQNLFLFHHCTLISAPSADKEKAFLKKEAKERQRLQEEVAACAGRASY